MNIIFFNCAVMHTFRLIEKSISSACDIVRQSHLQIFGSPSVAGIDAMDTTSSSEHRSFIDLPKELFQMLSTVGPYLYRDTLLLQKVHYFFSNILSYIYIYVY